MAELESNHEADGIAIDRTGRFTIVVQGVGIHLPLSPDEMRALALKLIEAANEAEAKAAETTAKALEWARKRR